MGSWNQLRREFDERAQAGPQALDAWLDQERSSRIAHLSTLLDGRPVLVYASAFLQKPSVPAEAASITHEDLNGIMSAIYGMDCSKGLTLVLHTPGGVTNAAETIVAYLRSKFEYIEVVVPTFAMSAGTMLALASDSIIMGRQSQLGPIDPQLVGQGRQVSAQAVTAQFEQAKREIQQDQGLGHVWAPILQSLGPALLQEAQNALAYSERMVAQWLARWMLAESHDAETKGKEIARHFNDASHHKSHGRRIDREEARAQGLKVNDLEDSQDVQEAVLNLYHWITVIFEASPITKMILSSTGANWTKQWTGIAQ